MNPTITITPSGTDPANTLQVSITVPATTTLFTGSLTELQKQIDDITTQIANLQAQQAQLQSTHDSITQTFTAAGVIDLTAPLTQDQANAVTSTMTLAEPMQPAQPL